MNRLSWRTAGVSLGVLIACSPPRAPTRATPAAAALGSASAAPQASPGSTPVSPSARQASARAPGSSRDVYGYLGKRGILGTLTADGARWSGSFHFVDGGQSVTLEGAASAREPDPDTAAAEAEAEEMARMAGRKLHSYLTCSFKALGASASVDDASCLSEGDMLEIDGTWSAGKTSEAFYLRTRRADTIDAEEYYAALLATPTSPHQCPPVVEVLSHDERHGRITLWYRLQWPCEFQSEAQRYQVLSGAPAAPSAPSYEAYVADLTESAPHRRLWSSQWASLADPDDPNEVSLHFDVLELAPGLELYAASVSDSFQSPISSGGNYSHQLTVWAVSVKGRYGAKLDLPASESGRGGWCIASSKSNETWLLDLDGDKISEIVIRITESGRQDGVGKNGQPECSESPTSVKFVTYRLNPGTLTWAPTPTPPGLNEQRLARGKPIEL